MEEDKHAFSVELAVPVNQPERRRQAKSVARRTRAVLLLDHLDTLRLAVGARAHFRSRQAKQ